MKLYATTTSERASKGQGGNEFIGITLMNEKKEVFGSISVWPSEDVLVRIHGQKFDISKEKGKSQKGEKITEDNSLDRPWDYK